MTRGVMGLLLSIKHSLFESVLTSLMLGSEAFSCFVVGFFFFSPLHLPLPACL